jgi:hypothetical protein
MSYSATTAWDWESIGAVAHGVGPSSDYLFKWTPPKWFMSKDAQMAPFI